MRQRSEPGNGLGTRHHLGRDACFFERPFHQPVEVGREHDLHEATLHQSRDRVMGWGGDLQPGFRVLLGRLEEAGEQVPPRPLSRCQSCEQAGVPERLSVALRRPPLLRILGSALAGVRVIRCRRGGGAPQEFRDHAPAGRDPGAS